MGRTSLKYLLPAFVVLLSTIPSTVSADPCNKINIPNADGIFKELNAARANPATYAQYLENQMQFYDGTKFRRPGEVTIRTKEGLQAVDEAIVFLKSVTPVSPLTWSVGLSKAAGDLVSDQSLSGSTGHQSGDGSWVGERADRYGEWTGKVGENIAYGNETSRGVVISLIVDDGVPSRGHRENIFEPDYRMVGIACGSHAICVVDFAESFWERLEHSRQ